MTTIVTDEEIAAVTVAPRVTPADIEAVIASEHYFTAAEGVLGAHASGRESFDAIPESFRLMTFCVLGLRNGFTAVGQSACASPENFDPVIGQRLARRDAESKIWPVLAYELRSKLQLLADAKLPDPSTDAQCTYIGSKVIHAREMSRGDYNALRGWSVPADENPDDLGYLVEYADGGEANVPGYKGYVSWSPKEVFEESYKLLG